MGSLKYRTQYKAWMAFFSGTTLAIHKKRSQSGGAVLGRVRTKQLLIAIAYQ